MSENKSDIEEDETNFIEPLFQIALHTVKCSFTKSSTIQPTYNDKLLLYSLFKQSIYGDLKNLSISKPKLFDLLGRAKWDAWKSKEGLSSLEAKKLYLESVLKILRSHRESSEAMNLIELFSSYENYSLKINGDHLSESDQDSEELNDQIIISKPSTKILNHPSNSIIREYQDQDEGEPEDSDLRPLDGGLGDLRIDSFATPSQLHDPFQSTSKAPASINLSKSSHHSPLSSNYNETSSEQINSADALSQSGKKMIYSERTFTEEQVRWLIHQSSPPQKTSPNMMNMVTEKINSHSSNELHLNPQTIDKFNRSIDQFENLLSKFTSQIDRFDTLLHQRNPLISNDNSNDSSSNLIPDQNQNQFNSLKKDLISSFEKKRKKYFFSFFNHLLLFKLKFRFSQFFFDFVVFFLLLKFFKRKFINK